MNNVIDIKTGAPIKSTFNNNNQTEYDKNVHSLYLVIHVAMERWLEKHKQDGTLHPNAGQAVLDALLGVFNIRCTIHEKFCADAGMTADTWNKLMDQVGENAEAFANNILTGMEPVKVSSLIDPKSGANIVMKDVPADGKPQDLPPVA